MSSQNPSIIWFRRDLRLRDNPALDAALQSRKPLILLYIDETKKDRVLGGAAKLWQHHSLLSLKSSIEAKGGDLILRRGVAADILSEIISLTGADEIHWNRRYGGWARGIDETIKTDLKAQGLTVHSHKANLLIEPWEIQTKTGGFLPSSLDWATPLMKDYQPGEAGAMTRLASFLEGPVENYTEQRNRPDDERGTSKLSPHLAFGEISPRQIWTAAKQSAYNTDKFLSEIGWREFSYTLLFYNPDLASKNYKPTFDKYPWENDPVKTEAWRQGQTGYPDPASNAASWQWVAGSGADASPYFRIFNPFTQGEKFDPNGDYVRKYVPELAQLPNKFIHQPWTASQEILAAAGVTLGENYPTPIVEHKMARERALAGYKLCRNS